MKVRQLQYCYFGCSIHQASFEKNVNGLLRTIRFRGAEFSVVRKFIDYELCNQGLLLLKYEDGAPKAEEVVQMKLFRLFEFNHLNESHKSLNDFLSNVDVREIKYDSMKEGDSARIYETERLTPGGLALVIYNAGSNQNSQKRYGGL